MRQLKSGRTHRRLIWSGSLLVAALTFVLTCAVPAWAADKWADITDAQWTQTYGITSTQAATVAQGYDNGTFHPSQTVTRAQYAKMVLSALGIPTATPPAPTFSDVPSGSYYFPWIEGGVTAGLIAAESSETYRPADPTTRARGQSSARRVSRAEGPRRTGRNKRQTGHLQVAHRLLQGRRSASPGWIRRPCGPGPGLCPERGLPRLARSRPR